MRDARAEDKIDIGESPYGRENPSFINSFSCTADGEEKMISTGSL